MPVKRDADGNIIEEKTQRANTFQNGTQQGHHTVPRRSSTEVSGGYGPGNSPPGAADLEGRSGYEAKTVLARSAEPDVQEQDTEAKPDDKTRVYRPKGKKAQAGAEAAIADAPDTPYTAMDDPPVGWLVVVQGPGKGNALTIGNGLNPIGRDQSERICMDFGDELISRRNHSTITYDPRGKRFYLQHGAGKNLTYLEDAPVLTPTELQGFAKITIGDTTLLFVPLCCDRFTWEDYE